MREHDYYEYDDEDPWEGVRLTKEAVRARATLVLYTAVVSVPFILLVACGGFMCGLEPYQVLGVSCYNSMLTTLIFFDSLRNAAHECFDKAWADGFVTCSKGIPVIAPTYPHRRLARLSFAIGGRAPRRR
ncbi:hypothetical protein LPW11_20480 [Geomonas sp. RF6]|uniref:hypothetical protein n=1 Tax=Geomonas sp. RF6 TaxID=2897342 RepID=UPI001E41E0E3|nr:hypothetical protein [Geomonas sp. RF6]UFS70238.1 hypothetical protein LPW11_20480 [Geomonas sp. RF6]